MSGTKIIRHRGKNGNTTTTGGAPAKQGEAIASPKKILGKQ